MGPWELLAWVGAVCLCVLFIAITVAVVVQLVRPNRTARKTTVMKGESRD